MKKMKSKPSCLPEDVLAYVLLRLPMRSLIRCRTVSRSWQSLIDSKEFTKLHLDRSVLQFDDVKIRELSSSSTSCPTSKFIWAAEVCCESKYCTKLYYVDFDSRVEMTVTLVELDYPFKSLPEMGKCIWGSCNGLLCLVYSDLSVMLWNPLIKKHCELPFSPVERCDELEGDLHYRVQYAFGCDDKREDYKVVRLVMFLDESELALYQEVKVYSSKSNSWSSIPLPPELPYLASCPGTCGAPLVNYSLHWIMFDKGSPDGYTSSSNRDVIVALDLSTDKYHLIPKPPLDDDHSIQDGWDLTVLDGSLCVVSGKGPFKHLWIMNDYGRGDSWTKLTCYISPLFLPVMHTEISTITHYDDEQGSFRQHAAYDSGGAASLIFASGLRGTVGGFHFVGSLVNPCCRTESVTTTRRSLRLRNKEERKGNRIPLL